MTLFKSLRKYKNNIAFISKDKWPISYSKLVKKSDLISTIIKERSLVLLITQNSIAPLIFYISLMRNNCVVMLVDIKTSIKDISNLIKIYKHSYLIGPNSFVKNFDDSTYDSFFKMYDYSVHLIKKYKKINMYSKLCILLPTSGSMGSPKFVRLSKQNLKENSKSIIKYLNIKATDRTITNMPFSYSYMLSVINTHIESGASIYVTDKSLTQRYFWEEFRKNKITSLNAVPYIYDVLIKMGLDNLKNISLKTLTHAGGKLKNESATKIIDFCNKNDMRFFSMYGQTEASPRISFLDWRFARTKRGSIGKSIPGGKMWLESTDGSIISKPKQIGELVYKGKNVSLGYSENINDLSKKNKNNFVLKTGDLAFFDKDKFFYLKGRLNRIAKIFGNRFNLEEVEERMIERGYEVVCQNLEDKIFVYSEKKYLKSEVIKNIVNITSQNNTAFKFISISKFPRTESGKIDLKKFKKISNND